MIHPQIRIQSSMLIFKSISEHERQSWAKKINQPVMSFSEVEEYTNQLKKVWSKYESSILETIPFLYGVDFKKPIIDIYVSPWNASISNPLIISPNRVPEIHIETVIHELLHVLFTDNTAFSMHDENQKVKLIDEWRNLFGIDLDWKTVVHIPVHAGLKAIFLETLDAPERVERDILRHQDNPAYKAAWEYVEKHDYHVINEQLKELYKQL